MKTQTDKIVDKWHEDLKRYYNRSVVPIMTTDVENLKKELNKLKSMVR